MSRVVTPDSYAWPQVDTLRQRVDAATITVLTQALVEAAAEINELKARLG